MENDENTENLDTEESEEYGEEYYEDDSQEELFKENPLKAIWIKLNELEESMNYIKKSIEDEIENEP